MTMQMIASCTNIMLYKWQRIKVMCNEKDLPSCVAPMLWNEQALSGIRKSESRSYLGKLLKRQALESSQGQTMPRLEAVYRVVPMQDKADVMTIFKSYNRCSKGTVGSFRRCCVCLAGLLKHCG